MSRVRKKQREKRIKSKKYAKLLIILVILVSCVTFLAIGCSKENKKTKENINPNNSIETFSPEDFSTQITLSAVGDIMVHEPQLKAQYDSSTKSYSFENNFVHIKKYIEESDLAIGNLETTLAGTSIPYSSYPIFNSPDALAYALKNSGFDLLSTINNHSLDSGDLGVNRTSSFLEEQGFETIGTKSNKENNDYIIKDIEGIKLGITSYSYGMIDNSTKYLNGLPASSNTKDKLNVFDMNNVDKAFSTIKSTLDKLKDTDMQIVIIHWGNEYQRTPSQFQTALAQKLCDAGVDIIIGSHPHVVQPVDMISSSDKKNQTLVIYSLGNFISNQRKEYMSTPYTEDGLLAKIEITKESKNKDAYVSNVTCIPTWVNKYYSGSKSIYEVIPIVDSEYLNTLENRPLEKLKVSYENTTSLVKTSPIINCSENPF